jgi:hypothetical protein
LEVRLSQERLEKAGRTVETVVFVFGGEAGGTKDEEDGEKRKRRI